MLNSINLGWQSYRIEFTPSEGANSSCKSPCEGEILPVRLPSQALRPDFTSKLVPKLAFGTPKFYIAPYDKIKHELVKLSSNCDVKAGLRAN